MLQPVPGVSAQRFCQIVSVPGRRVTAHTAVTQAWTGMGVGGAEVTAARRSATGDRREQEVASAAVPGMRERQGPGGTQERAKQRVSQTDSRACHLLALENP